MVKVCCTSLQSSQDKQRLVSLQTLWCWLKATMKHLTLSVFFCSDSSGSRWITLLLLLALMMLSLLFLLQCSSDLWPLSCRLVSLLVMLENVIYRAVVFKLESSNVLLKLISSSFLRLKGLCSYLNHEFLFYMLHLCNYLKNSSLLY